LSKKIYFVYLRKLKIKVMKKIKNMVESASTKIEAINMLNTWRLFGDITESQYIKGRELVRKEF